MRWWFASLLLLPACGPSAYAPGVLAREVDARAVRTLGCLEVGVGVSPPAHDGDAALLTVRVGNTCLRPVGFDLRKAVFVGIGFDERTRPLDLIDPRNEVTLLRVDAAASGTEKVRLRAREPGALAVVCVDLARVVPEAKVDTQRVCYADRGSRWDVLP